MIKNNTIDSLVIKKSSYLTHKKINTTKKITRVIIKIFIIHETKIIINKNLMSHSTTFTKFLVYKIRKKYRRLHKNIMSFVFYE